MSEEYLLWLYDLLESPLPAGELAAACMELAGRGLVPGETVPQLEVIPAHVTRARENHKGKDFALWASLVLDSPGLHFFHEARENPRGRCREAGEVRRELEKASPGLPHFA